MIKLQSGELKSFSRYIHSICAVSLDDSKGYLIEGRLSSLLIETGAESFAQLLLQVTSDWSGTLKRRIIEAIMTGEIEPLGWTNRVMVGSERSIIAGHARALTTRCLEMAVVPVILLGPRTTTSMLVLVRHALGLNRKLVTDLRSADAWPGASEQ